MPKNKKSDFSPQSNPAHVQGCEAEGCTEQGLYKAPRSRDHLHEYRWLCLDHVREHNKQWDYFDGMETAEIEQFMKEAVTGHRPTWSRESALKNSHEKLQAALDEFLGLSSSRAAKIPPSLPAKIRKSLAMMDMQYPYTLAELKSQYRALVKKFHPDVNKGNKEYEEKFKQITAAYHHLTEALKTL
jgi:hypothetical protein